MVHTTKKTNNTDSPATKKKKPFVRPELLRLWQQPPLTKEQKENLRANIKLEEERFKRMRENNKKKQD